MGSCISKCRPKSPSPLKDCNHQLVQDKLIVISQASTTTTTSSTTPSPPSSATVNLLPFKKTANSSSLPPNYSPSSSCITGTSCSSSTKSPPSSLSSPSFSISKDRFSNEFLWSCARDHPHIISPDHHVKYSSTTTPVRPAAAPLKSRSLNQSSTPLKRPRNSTSPTLTRQKSFRREPERVQAQTTANNSLRRRNNLGSLSPTPSRRHSGDACRGITKDRSTKEDQRKAVFSGPYSEKKKENLISHISNRDGSVLKRKETYTHRIGPDGLIDRDGAGLVVSKEIEDLMNGSLLIDDHINNPLISLDCFIFL